MAGSLATGISREPMAWGLQKIHTRCRGEATQNRHLSHASVPPSTAPRPQRRKSAPSRIRHPCKILLPTSTNRRPQAHPAKHAMSRAPSGWSEKGALAAGFGELAPWWWMRGEEGVAGAKPVVEESTRQRFGEVEGDKLDFFVKR